MQSYKFSDGFKWGSATSAHQVEGGNHNDWTEWEQSESRIKNLESRGLDPKDFISGKACDSYNRYEEDLDIAKSLSQNIHRFSIEWSRIEPEEGKFDFEAMKHYIGLVKAIRERGMEPMVTLWHFTNPTWFSKLGGFLNDKSSEYFTRYVKYVVDNLKNDVSLWITFNEGTTVYTGMAYLRGLWPPGYKSLISALRVRRNIIKSHTLSYREIKNTYSSAKSVPPNFGTTTPPTSHKLILQHNMSQNNATLCNTTVSHNVAVGSVENIKYIVGAKILKWLGMENIINNQLNFYFWSKTIPYQDFLGVNYYRVYRFLGSFSVLSKQDMATEMNWESYPEGIYHVLKLVKKFKKPIYITENGIADKTDEKRIKFIKDHLYWIWKATQDGVDLRGYIYWSLLDNFEWAYGYVPRFGLAEMDYQTLERKIRPSAYEYAKICKENTLNI